ncbi:uro-adherence factor A-like, partial [Trifolium medium]|nr:uro-adherence factor A-like [Trifolium medium]
MSSNMNDAEVCNQEDKNLKNDENNEDNSTPQSRQEHDASSEPNRLAE